MVVQEAQGLAFGHGGQPQAELGQFHRQRVQVHPVDAPLHHPPPPVAQLALLVAGSGEYGRTVGQRLAHHPGLDDAPRQVVGGLHQEMAAAHGRVRNVQGQDTVGKAVLQAGQLVSVGFCPSRRTPVPGLQRLDLFLHRFGLGVGQRPQGLLHDVLHDVIGGVVAAGGLAFPALRHQLHTQSVICHP